MNSSSLLTAAFARVQEQVHKTAQDLDPRALLFRIDSEANTIAWLLWHLARIQDDHIAGVASTPQVWTEQHWCDRFGLPFDATDTGYGHTADQVGRVEAPLEFLLGYSDAVHAATLQFLQPLTPKDLDRVVDNRWNPPVTLAVRLISILTDDLIHVGQAAYIRGVFEHR